MSGKRPDVISPPSETIEGSAPATPPTPSRPRERRRQTGTLGLIGGGLVSFVVVLAVFAPLIAPFSPVERAGRPFLAPSATHLLGTNDVGQDLFSQLLFGARASLSIGLLAATIAVVVGLAVALLAGHYRGAVETVLMRIVDMMMALPFLVLVVVLAAFFGRGLIITVAVIGGVIWARPARVLRSQVIKVREFQHVTAATAMGANGRRIMRRHIVPRLAPLAVAQFVRAANVAVLIEASLAFLGLGDPERVSWGTTLYFAQVRNAFLTDAWLWWIVPPGLALTAVIVGLAFLGHEIEEWADPRLDRTARRAVARRAGTKIPPPNPDAPSVLDVQGLSVDYRGRSAVHAVVDVDLVVGRGRLVGLVGESGSGKSTLVMAVSGMLRAPGKVRGGVVLYGGRDVGFPSRAGVAAVRGRGMALIPQNAMNALNPSHHVLRQVAESAALTRTPPAAAARAAEVLELVGIPAERHRAFPHELSGGMRQRVVIAMAIANEPSLLVADEPITGLDVVTQARILGLLIDLRDRLDLGILLVSHDVPLVARVADDLAVMYAGRIVEQGEAGVVAADPKHPYTRLLLASFPKLRGGVGKLASITGDPPDLSIVPAGCPFAPRCPDVMDECLTTLPVLDDSSHAAACLLADRS